VSAKVAWHLDVDLKEERAKLDEFRATTSRSLISSGGAEETIRGD